MSRVSDENLTGHLSEMLDEWEAIRAHQRKHGRRSTVNSKGDNTWWINQECYFAERFGAALVDDLLEARGLPPRAGRDAKTKVVSAH